MSAVSGQCTTFSGGASVTTAIICFGGDATVTMTASGGTAPYTYTLNSVIVGPTTSTSVTFVVPANIGYSWVITDAALPPCIIIGTLQVIEPAVLAAAESHTPIACFGGNSTVTISTAGGTVPYTGTGTFSQAVGTQSYTVTDANGCTDVVSVTLTEPAVLAAAESHTPIACFGGNSTVTISAAGGTVPYTGTGTFSQAVGTQSYTVTDANGCTDVVSVTLTEPAVLAAAESHTPIACFGGNSTVTISAAGGTAPYTGTGTFSQAVGTQSYTVTDANGCTDVVSVTLTEPAVLAAAESHTPIACFGGNSTVTISAAGGTAPYTGTGTFSQAVGTQSYTVTDANGCTDVVSVTLTEPAVLAAAESHTPIACFGGNSTVTISAAGGTAPYTGTGTFSQAVGTQSYTVTDANGCTDVVSVTLTEPAVLAAAESHTPIACFGGNSTVTISAVGGTVPYTGTGTFSQAVGTQSYTVTDANGCTDVVSVTLTEPAVLAAAESHTPIACFGGNSTVTISAAGGTVPYTGTGTFSQAVGTQSYTVTDAYGCTTFVDVTITQPAAALTASIIRQTQTCFNLSTGTVTISGNGGTLPYQYGLDGGPFQSSGDFTGLGVGSYTATVRDANGCTNTVSVIITSLPPFGPGINKHYWSNLL